MIKSYKFILVLLITFTVTYMACFAIATEYNNIQYANAMEKVNEGLLLTLPVKNGLSSETNIIYNEVKQLSPKNNLILIGPSTVRDGIIINESKIPKSWDIHNFAISGVQLSECMLLVNYIDAYANHKPDRSDVIVFHMSYFTFFDSPEDQQYVTQNIEAYGFYTIDENLHVHGYMPDAYREWILSKEEIMAPLSDITGINKFSVGQSAYLKIEDISTIILNSFNKPASSGTIATSPSPEEIEQYGLIWQQRSQNITFTPEKTKQFEAFLRDVNNQTNIVIINMYLPSWQKDLEKQKEYQNWSQSELIPFLKENNITYIDFSNSFSDNEFADSGHLNDAGREHFTRAFDSNITPLLENISRKSDDLQ